MAFRTLEINPVTRIEGHAKISLHLGESGRVEDARFHVTQFRGFEKLCEGRPFTEMPSVMARICGICPVSHLVASAKACDAIMAVQIPPTAQKLRRIMNQAQIVQSHALNFFHLSSPDLLLGMDADPAERNILGVLKKYPSLAKDGIRLRQFGQQIIAWLGGKRIHPAWIVPGGVNEPLTEELREKILAGIPEAYEIIERTVDWFKRSLSQYQEEIRTFANFPSLFMGLVSKDKQLEHYDGRLRFVDSSGHIVADNLDPVNYRDYIGETVEDDSYLKSPYFRPLGPQEGMYRVGPLARLNVIDGIKTPRARQEWAEFRGLERGAVLSSFQYHYARLVEIIYGIELIEQLMNEPDILSNTSVPMRHRITWKASNLSATRTLIHHYKVNEEGLMEWANSLSPPDIKYGDEPWHSAGGKTFVDGNNLTEGMLNA